VKRSKAAAFTFTTGSALGDDNRKTKTATQRKRNAKAITFWFLRALEKEENNLKNIG
jgi:hypothetical protein